MPNRRRRGLRLCPGYFPSALHLQTPSPCFSAPRWASRRLIPPPATVGLTSPPGAVPAEKVQVFLLSHGPLLLQLLLVVPPLPPAHAGFRSSVSSPGPEAVPAFPCPTTICWLLCPCSPLHKQYLTKVPVVELLSSGIPLPVGT